MRYRFITDILQVLEHSPGVSKGRMRRNALMGQPINKTRGQGSATATDKDHGIELGTHAQLAPGFCVDLLYKFPLGRLDQ